jgi:hypothetical protein
MPEYIVQILWDAEAGVWIAASGDILGLVLESGSLRRADRACAFCQRGIVGPEWN